MEIINPGNEDYHIHSINFSDGLNTIDEIVKFAGEIGLTKNSGINYQSIIYLVESCSKSKK